MGGRARGGALRGGLVLLAGLALALACDDGPAGTGGSGRVDLSRVVAVGDGYPAGATDGALYATAQRMSVPALFARRVARGDEPALPLVADPGFSVIDPEAGGRLVLADLAPLAIERLPRGGPPLAPDLPRPYDDLGVPGALVAEALGARSSATSLFGNPFFDLVLRGRGTFAEQVAEREATLVLLWIGTSDALAWVAAGGDPALAPGLPTPAGTFGLLYGRLVDQLLETTDRVVLFTVPDVTALPVVTATPTVVLDPATGDTLRDRFGAPIPLLGPAGPLTPNDRLTLAALPLLEAGAGIPVGLGGNGQPLPGRVVLTPLELEVAASAVAAYNDVIEGIADERDLAVVDVRAFVEELVGSGVVTDGVLLTDAFPGGQAFGLDGAHFTPKAYGVLVNRLVAALNRRYGGSLAPIRTADLPGVPLLHVGEAVSILPPAPVTRRSRPTQPGRGEEPWPSRDR